VTPWYQATGSASAKSRAAAAELAKHLKDYPDTARAIEEHRDWHLHDFGDELDDMNAIRDSLGRDERTKP
jgi:CxxC motif-containing protein (DUF1111 family)